jgi:hypothetical protein
MLEIRVLLYTDYLEVKLDKPTRNAPNVYGLYFLKRAVEAKTPSYVKINFELVNRHEGGHAANKLTPELLNKFDELWVFGRHQINLPVLLGNPAQPEMELTLPEVGALREWMLTHGVLITGDHSNQNPITPNSDHSTYLNLGRALGHKIPRARELRLWQGPPTTDRDDFFNTQTPDGEHDIEDEILGADGLAQALTLDKIDGNVHRLFWKNIRQTDGGITFEPIEVFPDHLHEGAAIVPSSFGEDWPGTARPLQVASGFDRRTSKLLPVVIAYDGGTDAGRIVADSTWHHYFNVNLSGFPKSADDEPLPGTPFDDIAQYYVNLALWLAPKEVRYAMPLAVFSFLARHPQVFEVARGGTQLVGGTASNVLERQVGLSNFWWALLPSEFEEREPPEINGLLQTALFDAKGADGRVDVLTLGMIIEQFHEMWLLNGIVDPTGVEGAFDEEDIVRKSLMRAFSSKAEQARESSEDPGE